MADKRLIDANALLKEIEDWHDSLGGTMNPADWGIQNVLQSVMDYINEAEDIDAVPVVHGRWMWEGRFKACSECGTYIDWDNTLGANHWRYCPRCGAKMDGGAADGSNA